MKLTLIFLIAAVLNVSAKGFSQNITYSGENVPLEEVFKALKKQSGLLFLYSEKVLLTAKPVTISAKEEKLDFFLNKLFENQPLKFAIVDGNVLVSPKLEAKLPTLKLLADMPPIKGIIRDADGKPLGGVSITIKGTNRGTQTDGGGQFQLDATKGDILVFSSIGFQSIEQKINDQVILNIQLNRTSDSMEEVAVVSTGYEKLPRERATGSFTTISNETFNRRVGSNVIDRLEGVASGLTFNRNLYPGESNTSSISIRGLSTIFANQKPLIIVDNFAYDGDLNNINPNDVSTVTILKDAAAASIWGARSGNGVIVITTKSGNINKPLQISFNANINYTEKPNIKYGFNFLNSNEFIEAETFLFNNGQYDNDLVNSTNRPLVSPVVEILAKQREGLISSTEAATQIDGFKNIDYRDDVRKHFYQSSVAQQYALNISGGGRNSSYYVSLSYDNIPSILKRNQSERLNLSSLYTFNPVKNLEISAGISYSQTKSDNNNSALEVPGGGKSNYYPYLRLTNEEGNSIPIMKNYRLGFVESLATTEVLDWHYNPIKDLALANNKTERLYNKLNLGFKYTLLEGLSAELRFQQEKQQSNGSNLHVLNSFYTRDLINLYTQVNNGIITKPIPEGDIFDCSFEDLSGKTIRAQINFNRNFSQTHQVSAIAGIEGKEVIVDLNSDRLYGYSPNGSGSSTVDYTSYFSNYQNLSWGGLIPYFSRIDKLTDEYLSYYSNFSYTYARKYVISASGRIDESNLFGVKTNQKKVPLWSAGFAWNMSEENFYSLDPLPYLRLRATYGYNGNIDKSVSAMITAIYASTNNLTGAPIVYIQNPPNPQLRWEKIGMLNVGFDFKTKNNLLSGSIEYFSKEGKDIIGFGPTDPTVGVTQYKGNVAGIKGQGFDVNLTVNVGKKLNWISNLLISRATDKVTAYNKNTSVAPYLQLSDGSLGVSPITPIVGKPIFSVLSYKWAGLDPTNGDPQGYLDGKVSKDYASMASKTTFEDIVVHGSARPTTFGNLRNTFAYREFSFSFNIGYKLGYYFRRPSIFYTSLAYSWIGNADFVNRWMKPDDEKTTFVPSFTYPTDVQRDNFYQYSDVLVEKGDHIRLQDISITYNVYLKSLHNKSFQVYGYLNNLGIIWKATSANIDPDYLTNQFANPKSFAIGLRASL